jgi:hypothetical protein
MANPAALLLDQFRSWDHPNQTADTARGTSNPEAWLPHRLAVRHLDAIEEILAEMAAQGKNVAVYQGAFVIWSQIVFAWPRGWGQANSAQIDGTTLQHLDTLASRLEDYLPTTDEAGRDRTRELVEEVRAAIDSDNSVPADMKIHLFQLADQLSWCMDNYSIAGDFELKTAIDRLLITVGVTAQESKQGGIWTTIVNNFVYPFVASTTASLTGQSILMLTGAG